MAHRYPLIDIPFEHRHQCWFCGEPRYTDIDFPRHAQEIRYINHPALSIPVCHECRQLITRSGFYSILSYRKAIKQKLAKKHKKILDIGINWTEQELAEVELEGRDFENFKRSAWPMYTLMQGRIDFKGWPLAIDGQSLDIEDEPSFEFDGKSFNSIENAIEYAVKTFFLDEKLFVRILAFLGRDKFAQAIRLCRLYPRVEDGERDAVYQQIIAEYQSW
ncbi:hypothetical protein HR060_06355 [Catenovulum sp. SM1970]|uniref:hypothetical protein n=1 Tax=Marinifaba aquimaris TaxID=2741323 RepID=UPI001574AC96|nr:hypothetical protein [Marinifaba aquimaris]NTS76488.1 hypothetical protein [Marinifaba aquimaris]